MLSNDNFELVNCQLALFFSSEFQMRSLKIANEIQKNLSILFSVDPSPIPYPPNFPIPPEAPRVILEEENVGKIAVSQVRADIILNITDKNLFDININEIVEKFVECFEDEQLVRVGFILIFNIVANDTVALIEEEFILPQKLDGLKEFQLGWTKRLVIDKFEINKVINFNCSLSQPSIYNKLLVDVNTIPETVFDLKANDINLIVNACLEQYRRGIGEFVNR